MGCPAICWRHGVVCKQCRVLTNELEEWIWDMANVNYMACAQPIFLQPSYPLFLMQTKTGKGKMYTVVKLCHCAFLL